MRRHLGWTLLCVTIAAMSLISPAHAADELTVEQTLDIAPVWSGHPVRFALLTHGNRQFIAFYDAERQMTVGSRTVDSEQWQFQKLPSSVGWDSHNSITMVVDSTGNIHLSGNMHCVPLIYFRTTRPFDIASFQQIKSMVGRNETRCTYPRFLRGAEGELIFVYRDGGSGNGSRYFNIYNPENQTWRRLIDGPLFSGQGKMNAYFVGPVRDKSGTFHVCWVWRDTPDCATNHHLSYARSGNLVHWKTAAGKDITLPMTIDNAEVVDPVPPGGGMINGNTKIGFDGRDRVILSYHKYDADGKTQIYNARHEADGWRIYQTSDWKYRWEFSGGGSIPFNVRVGSVTVAADGSLTQRFSNPQDGSSNQRLDEATLQPTGSAPAAEKLPREISRLESTRPGMGVRTAGDMGKSEEPGVRYMLRWETLPTNRDRPHEGGPPPPSMLRLVRLRKVASD